MAAGISKKYISKNNKDCFFSKIIEKINLGLIFSIIVEKMFNNSKKK